MRGARGGASGDGGARVGALGALGAVRVAVPAARGGRARRRRPGQRAPPLRTATVSTPLRTNLCQAGYTHSGECII